MQTFLFSIAHAMVGFLNKEQRMTQSMAEQGPSLFGSRVFFLFLFLNHDNQPYKTMQLSHPSVSFASILVDNFFLEY